jgi:hypothetical protein
MTKREIESGNIKMVINLIENQFNGSVEDNGEGGRLDIFVDGHQGQFARRDFEVMLVNAMKLYGPGWTDEDIQNHQDAVKLENAMNTAIEKLFNH